MDCENDVLSVEEVSRLLENVYPYGIPLYRKLHKFYSELCTECQRTTRIRTRNMGLIKKITKLGKFLNLDILQATNASDKFNEIVTPMLCRERRCTNLDEFSDLDRHFLNWMSHRSSYMGHSFLGMSRDEIERIRGARTEEQLKSNACEILQPRVMELLEMGQVDLIENANKCYYASYLMRMARHPGDLSNPIRGVCRERYSAGHDHEKKRDRMVSEILAIWLDAIQSSL